MNTIAQDKTKIRTSQVLDSDVLLASGEVFGRIADIIVDDDSDKILFVAVQRRGALTATDNFCKVDSSTLQYDRTANQFVFSLSGEKLAELPSTSGLSELVD